MCAVCSRRRQDAQVLAYALLIAASTLVTYLCALALGRMEAKGLITRVPAEEGGKRNQISLTERGKQICDEMADYMEEENVKIFDGLTQEDKETAARLFLVITENLAK